MSVCAYHVTYSDEPFPKSEQLNQYRKFLKHQKEKLTAEPHKSLINDWSSTLRMAVDDNQVILREILEMHPAGLQEYDLLKELAARDVSLFNENYFNNSFGLFQRHFLLFHCLYVLRNQLLASEEADLSIHCMDIQLLPYNRNASKHPAIQDPLASYYLDLENLKNTSEEDVLRLLENFWKKCTSDEKRDEALAVLQLSHPTNYSSIKQQYRRLAMDLHPDRGGEPEDFHELESAMEVLRILYR